MEYCPTAKRMEAACPIIMSGKFNMEFCDLGAEMDQIAKLLVKCCNDYMVKGDADGMEYMSEIDTVKTFLPVPESYRNLIEKNCTNSSYDPADPEFYRFKILKVVDGTITFKSLFTLAPTEESVVKYVVLQAGQRFALILVSQARIALLQSRFYTALACCRVGLILVRTLNSISSRALWISHHVLFFLLAAEAVESCAILAAFDHLSCTQCAKIIDQMVWSYRDFVNIFRSYGGRLSKAEEDLMLDGGGSLADIGTICEKLETELQLNEFVGYDLQFQFSMFYFHLAVKDIAAQRTAQQLSVTSITPRNTYVKLCVKAFEELFDSYMMAAALFCRGCFRSALGHRGPNRRRTKKLMAAERDFLYVLDMAKEDHLQLSSMPWQRLIEKAYLANLVTQCRILVRCASLSDVEHFRKSLDHLYSLAKWRSSFTAGGGSPSSRQFSALACLAFLYLTDHIQGEADVFKDSEKGIFLIRRAKCEAMAFQLLENEATLSFCVKVFSDLSKEGRGGEEGSTNWESQLRRCLHRLRLLSVPIFAAVNSLFSLTDNNATVMVCSNNTGRVPFSQFKPNGLQPPECGRGSCGYETTATASPSSDAMQCHNSTLKMSLIYDEEDHSKYFLLDKLQSSSVDSFAAVNSLKKNISLKTENFVLTDALKISNNELRLKEKNHSCSIKLSSTINLATLKAELDSLRNETTLSHAMDNKLLSQSKMDQNVHDNETSRILSSQQDQNRPLSTLKPNFISDGSCHENLVKWSQSPLQDLLLNTSQHYNSHNLLSSCNRNNNHVGFESANASISNSNRVVADSNLTHSRQKSVTESLTIYLVASPALSKCSPPIIDTSKVSIRMESANFLPLVLGSVVDDIVTALLDQGFDSLMHRKTVSAKENVFPNSPLEGGISSTAYEDWVAEFPPNAAPLHTSLGLRQSCAKQLSGIIQESPVSLRGNLYAKGNCHITRLVEENSDSQNLEQRVHEVVGKSNIKSVSRKLPEDTESWLVFLRRCNLLKIVEDNLVELFFIDGTDDLLCLKTTITEDLQILCRAIDFNKDNPCPAYLSVHAHDAYTTAQRHLKRGSGLKDFHSLLMALFDAMDEEPFGSAPFWT